MIWWAMENHGQGAGSQGGTPAVAGESPGGLDLQSGAANGASNGGIAEGEIAEARDFLLGKVLPATDWQAWLPVVRKADVVEPLMRGYYGDKTFVSMKGMRITSERGVVNANGRFVVFLLEGSRKGLAMVELGADGPLLDWEMTVNYPQYQWVKILENRPAGSMEAAVFMARCYTREELLLEQEWQEKDKVLGVRLSMPGNPDTLFAAVPAESELGRWVAGKVPWEHENRGLLVRVEMAFSEEHALMPERVGAFQDFERVVEPVSAGRKRVAGWANRWQIRGFPHHGTLVDSKANPRPAGPGLTTVRS